MARVIQKLSALTVSKAKKRGYLADGGGLYLQVSTSGAKSWVFRYRAAGKLHEMGLGPLHTVSLAEAREAALQQRKQRLSGADPIAARQASRAAALLASASAKTFQQSVEAYIEAHRSGWGSAKHAAQWEATLTTYALPTLGKLPVAGITTGLVHDVLAPIWNAKTETASRLRGRIEAVLDYAAARGWRTGDNPARWKGHLEQTLPARGKVSKVEHHPALPYGEIAAFMSVLRQQQQSMAALALQFLVLTAARTGEIVGAKWAEISLADAVWTLPAGRMKAGREHRVPLSEPALAILRPLHNTRISDYVFPGVRQGQPLSSSAMLKVLHKLGRDDLTIHGFRSTFRDWAAEKTEYASEIVEMALAHAAGSKVEAAYRRGDLLDKRRQLMADWALTTA